MNNLNLWQYLESSSLDYFGEFCYYCNRPKDAIRSQLKKYDPDEKYYVSLPPALDESSVGHRVVLGRACPICGAFRNTLNILHDKVNLSFESRNNFDKSKN